MSIARRPASNAFARAKFTGLTFPLPVREIRNDVPLEDALDPQTPGPPLHVLSNAPVAIVVAGVGVWRRTSRRRFAPTEYESTYQVYEAFAASPTPHTGVGVKITLPFVPERTQVTEPSTGGHGDAANATPLVDNTVDAPAAIAPPAASFLMASRRSITPRFCRRALGAAGILGA
jgi:hypothetical protein